MVTNLDPCPWLESTDGGRLPPTGLVLEMWKLLLPYGESLFSFLFLVPSHVYSHA